MSCLISIGRFSAVPHWPVLGVPQGVQQNPACRKKSLPASKPCRAIFRHLTSQASRLHKIDWHERALDSADREDQTLRSDAQVTGQFGIDLKEAGLKGFSFGNCPPALSKTDPGDPETGRLPRVL